MPIFLLKILGNKYAVMAIGLFIGLTAALSWHYIDKAIAVRNAEQALADQVLIATQEALLESMEKRAVAAEANLHGLEIKAAVAEADTIRATQELEKHERTTEVNAKCVVDDVLIKRLHNR